MSKEEIFQHTKLIEGLYYYKEVNNIVEIPKS